VLLLLLVEIWRLEDRTNKAVFGVV